MCGRHIGLSCNQPAPLPICPEATIPNCTGAHTYYLYFLILCAQERAVRVTHLGLSCTQPAPVPVCTETTLPNCRVTLFLFNIFHSRASSARYPFRSLYTHPTPLPVCMAVTLPDCTAGYHPDDEPCRNIWRRGRRKNLNQTGRGTLPNCRGCNPEYGSKKTSIRPILQ